MIVINGSAKAAIAPYVRLQWEPVQRGYVLLYPEGLVRLNATAAEILHRCDGETCLSQIIADLERLYGTSAGVGNSVMQFVAVAVDRRWLELRP